MKGTSRVTVSLPTQLLEAVDERLIKGDEGRSALIRRLLEDALRREAEERVDSERFIRAYREQPQTEEELGWAEQATREWWLEHPWK
jgi:metal-responsive CopG/Arc/MetJ family transcriptional regulator